MWPLTLVLLVAAFVQRGSCQEMDNVCMLQTRLHTITDRNADLSLEAPSQALARGEAQNLVVSGARANGWGDVLGHAIQMVETVNPDSKEADEARDLEQHRRNPNVTKELDVLNAVAEEETVDEAIHNKDLVTGSTMAEITGTRAMESDCGGNGSDCAEGDMKLESPQKRAMLLHASVGGRQGKWVGAGAPWAGGVVKYCFASDVSDLIKGIFRHATEQYHHAVPCLTFQDVGNSAGLMSSVEASSAACDEAPAIFVQSKVDSGCWSYVGFVSTLTAQPLQLEEPGCGTLGIALHELGHALGMQHEHVRSDRDNYVAIHWANIKPGKESNFELHHGAYVGNDYDYASIMHYDGYTFSVSKGDLPTVTTVTGAQDMVLGQEVGITHPDAEQVALMYAAENSSCAAQSIATAKACRDINITICSALNECVTDMHADDCCACGGGFEYQCWEGQTCSYPSPLPVVDHFAECIEDNTASYSQYECVVKNTCGYTLHVDCPQYYPGSSWNLEGFSGNVLPPYSPEFCQRECRTFMLHGSEVLTSTTTTTTTLAPAAGTGSECVVDYTATFISAGYSYACVVKNECLVTERVRCPNHPGYYWDFGGPSGYKLPPWTDVCAGACTFEVLP